MGFISFCSEVEYEWALLDAMGVLSGVPRAPWLLQGYRQGLSGQYDGMWHTM